MVDVVTLEILFEDRKARQMISDIKFSKSGDLIALASFDGKVYIHNAASYALQKTVELPVKMSKVKSVDFSEDSNTLRIAANDSELYLYSLTDQALLSQSVVARDTEWFTHSCPYSWNCQGT